MVKFDYDWQSKLTFSHDDYGWAFWCSLMNWHPNNILRGMGDCGLCNYAAKQREPCSKCQLAKLWGKNCTDSHSRVVKFQRARQKGDTAAQKEHADRIFRDLQRIH